MASIAIAPPRPLERPAVVLALLGGLALLAIALFMTLNARGSWDFVLPFRGRKVVGLVLVAYAIAVSTVLFQTVTANRILTPAVMGFDSLYALVQTGLVFVLGGTAYTLLDPQLRFAGNALVMVALSVLLFRFLFGTSARSLHLLVLVGIVVGILFRTLSDLLQRLLAPNEFTLLQDALFARFNAIDPGLLVTAAALIAIASLMLIPVFSRLDVLILGRDNAVSLGVDHRRTVTLVLTIVAVLVSVSTALVGPVLFFGLLVANLAYLVTPTWRHAHVLPAAVFVSIAGLVGGQAVVEHLFGYDTALSVVIEFVGGVTFLVLLLRGAAR